MSNMCDTNDMNDMNDQSMVGGSDPDVINGVNEGCLGKVTLPVKRIGDMEVTVVPAGDPLIRKAAEEQILSDHDKQMDRRAKAAVRSVLERARVCGNAVAKYDKETKTTYLEYPDGTREDVL